MKIASWNGRPSDVLLIFHAVLQVIIIPTLAFQLTLAPSLHLIPNHAKYGMIERYVKSSWNGYYGSSSLLKSHEIQDMEDFVLSLSLDSDDQSRRHTFATLLNEKLQTDDYGESFIKLFDNALIVVGDRIRQQATELSTSNRHEDVNDTDILPTFPLPSQQKTNLEQQLWACVDLMVQSKTLIKSARDKIKNE